MSIDLATYAKIDRCAALLTLRGTLGKVSRVGAVRVAIGELEDRLAEAEAAAGEVGNDG
jgi:hypothetical protein